MELVLRVKQDAQINVCCFVMDAVPVSKVKDAWGKTFDYAIILDSLKISLMGFNC